MFAWTLTSPPVDHSTSVTPGKQIIWTWFISWHYCTFPQEAGFGALPGVRQGSWNLGVWPRPQAGAVRQERPHVPSGSWRHSTHDSHATVVGDSLCGHSGSSSPWTFSILSFCPLFPDTGRDGEHKVQGMFFKSQTHRRRQGLRERQSPGGHQREVIRLPRWR